MHYIQKYYNKLNDLRRFAGGSNEDELRSAFQNLLKNIAEEHQLILKADSRNHIVTFSIKAYNNNYYQVK